MIAFETNSSARENYLAAMRILDACQHSAAALMLSIDPEIRHLFALAVLEFDSSWMRAVLGECSNDLQVTIADLCRGLAITHRADLPRWLETPTVEEDL